MDRDPKTPRIAITGFMGVGKSTVSRHLARLVDLTWIDLDFEIERAEGRSISEVVSVAGIEAFRVLESSLLARVLQDGDAMIISLGGGTFTSEPNRRSIREFGVTSIWLEASFDHCWANIRDSFRERPLAKERKQAKILFEQRTAAYCLADWHFIIRSGCNSLDVAKQIAEELYEI